jgi:hypothetical protein
MTIHLARIFFQIGMLSFACSSFNACIHPKVKFQKAKLLDPLMDPAKDRPLLDSSLAEPQRRFEKGDSATGSGTGATCPTCGGG